MESLVLFLRRTNYPRYSNYRKGSPSPIPSFSYGRKQPFHPIAVGLMKNSLGAIQLTNVLSISLINTKMATCYRASRATRFTTIQKPQLPEILGTVFSSIHLMQPC